MVNPYLKLQILSAQKNKHKQLDNFLMKKISVLHKCYIELLKMDLNPEIFIKNVKIFLLLLL
jgi:hypothetical protein